MTRQTADVVIVGAGVVGASVAWHLARRGCERIVVLEQGERPGEGSTGRATGGFRAQFDREIDVRLSLLAREKLLRFGEEVGGAAGYDPCGYLLLASDDAQLATLREAMAVQRAAGLGEVREVAHAAIAELNPHVRTDEVVGGSFCPTDGFLRPLGLLAGYLDAARRLGVEVRCGEAVRRIGVEGATGRRRVVGVATDRGEIGTRCVVDAAGAWAAVVAALAGVELPVVPARRQVAATRPFRGLPERMPLTVWLGDGFHLRVCDGRVLLLWPRPSTGEGPFDTRFDERWLDRLEATARRRVPRLAETGIDRSACWCGLYEMSPDHRAILGESPEVAGLYFANGSSGHGVMHAPALGHLLSEIMIDGAATTLDVTALSPGRFDAAWTPPASAPI